MRRRGGGEEVLRRCCGKLQDGSLLTPQKLSKNNQLKSPGMGNGMWNGGMKWRQEAATGGGATGGYGGRQRQPSSPPALPGGAPGRRGGARPPAHAEHAGIRRYGDMVLGAVMALESDVLQFLNLV